MKQSRFLMCPPTHFDVEYVINPWMEGQLNAANTRLASAQWSSFHKLMSDVADVALMPPVNGLPDLVFTANAALVHRDSAVLSSFRHPERQPESRHYAEWLTADGFNVRTLPDGIRFEGAGDALIDRGRPLLWFGHGFRSDLAAKPFLERWTGLEVQPLRLRDSRFYHLDTCFCPLEEGLLIYFPEAFDEASRSAIESRVPADQRFALSDAEAVTFACNAVNIGKTVILNHASPETAAWLTSRGFDVVPSGVSEFMKAGGATKCLSLRLDEA